MKKLIIILFLYAIILSLQSCQKKDSPELSEKAMTHIVSESNSEESSEPPLLNTPRALICLTAYDTNGTETSRTEYGYDKYGNKIYELFYDDGELFRSTHYTYDQNQNLVRTVDTDLYIEQRYISEYEYDNNGNKISETISKGHDYLNRRIYEYDEHNRVIKISNSLNNSTVTYTYGEDNSCIKLERCEYNGEIILNQTEERYNESGSLIYQATYKQNSLIDIEYKTTNTYNTIGLLETSQTYIGDTLLTSIANEYRENLLIRTTSSDSAGVYLIVEYEYDSFGNIIKQIQKSPSGLILEYYLYNYAE